MVILSYTSPSEGLFVGAMQGLLIATVFGIIALVKKKKRMEMKSKSIRNKRIKTISK